VYVSAVPLNSLSFSFKLFRTMWFSICLRKFSEIFKVLGFPFFAVVGVTSLCSRSMSLTFRLHTSIGRIPVSLLSFSFVASILPDEAIICSNFSEVGILMCLAVALYFGISHFIL